MFSLPDFLSRHDQKDIFFIDEREVLPFSGYPRGLETNKTVLTVLQVTEKNDKLSDNYKVELDPILPYFGNFRTYLSDFESMVEHGSIRPVQRLTSSVTPARLDSLLDESSVVLMDGFIPKQFLGLKYVPKDSRSFTTTFCVKKIGKNSVELAAADASFADIKIDKAELADLINTTRAACFLRLETETLVAA